MKKLKKVLFFIFILVLVVACGSYIDYYFASSNNTYPRLAYKKHIDADLDVYNALFYRMWYCKSNEMYILGDYKDEDAACQTKRKYTKGYYTNGAGLKFSEDELELISTVYSDEQIENMSSKTTLENAYFVAREYSKLKFEYVIDEETEENQKLGKYNLVKFPEYKKNKKGNYEWVYDTDTYYCLTEVDSQYKYAEIIDEKCGEFNPLVYSSKWCELMTNSNLAFDKEITDICKGE